MTVSNGLIVLQGKRTKNAVLLEKVEIINIVLLIVLPMGALAKLSYDIFLSIFCG